MKVLVFGMGLIEYESDAVFDPVVMDLGDGLETLEQRYIDIMSARHKNLFGAAHYDWITVEFVITPSGEVYAFDDGHIYKKKVEHVEG